MLNGSVSKSEREDYGQGRDARAQHLIVMMMLKIVECASCDEYERSE